MIRLRDAVYSADKTNADTKQPLKNLQNYVTAHMNTNLSSGPNAPYPPIQLKYTYERLVKSNGTAVADANNKIYSEAQKYCEQQNSTDFSGRNRVPCIEQYVNSHKCHQSSLILCINFHSYRPDGHQIWLVGVYCLLYQVYRFLWAQYYITA